IQIRWATGATSVSQHRFERAFGQGHQEPYLERQEQRDGDSHPEGRRGDHSVLAEPDHEGADEDCRGDVNADVDDPDDVNHHRNEDPQNLKEWADLDERAGFRSPALEHFDQLIDQDRRAGNEQDDADIEREVSGLRSAAVPARAQFVIVDHHDGGKGNDDNRRRDFHRADRNQASSVVGMVTHSTYPSLVIAPFVHSYRSRPGNAKGGRPKTAPLPKSINYFFLARNPAFSI